MRLTLFFILVVVFSSCRKEEEYTFNISVYDAQTNLPIDTGVIEFLAKCDNCWSRTRFYDYIDVNSSGVASKSYMSDQRVDFFRAFYLEDRMARSPRQTLTGCLSFGNEIFSCTNDRNEYNLEIRVWRE